jgi:hypothetical protein
MLIGGYVLVRMLCYFMLFRTTEYSIQYDIPEEVEKYFKLIGLIIYTSYMDQFVNSIQPDPGNIEEITLHGAPPTPRTKPLYFCKYFFPILLNNFFSDFNQILAEKQKNMNIQPDTEKNFLLGAPSPEDLQFLYTDNFMEDIGRKIRIFLNNMYQQVRF